MAKKFVYINPLTFSQEPSLSAQREEKHVWWQRELKKSFRNSRPMCSYHTGYQFLYFFRPSEIWEEGKQMKNILPRQSGLYQMQGRLVMV